MKSSTKDQIGTHGEEIDGVGPDRLQQESKDLAQQDGRAEARDADRERAFRELTGPAGDPAPEVPAGAEELVTWDVSPEAAGHLTPEVAPDDEADVSTELADEGRVEAEQELRRAANAESRHRPD